VVAGAAAGTLDDGVAAYQRGDYAKAMRLLRPLADQGNPDAQFNLGMMTPMAMARRKIMAKR
jgi:TPR repeat protein